MLKLNYVERRRLQKPDCFGRRPRRVCDDDSQRVYILRAMKKAGFGKNGVRTPFSMILNYKWRYNAILNKVGVITGIYGLIDNGVLTPFSMILNINDNDYQR